jgi:OOP family OmpA-OmpF porin
MECVRYLSSKKEFNMKKIVLAAVLAGCAAAPVFAGDFYVVGTLGQSTFDLSKSDIDRSMVAAGVPVTSSSLDKSDVAYKIQLGYQFNPYVAIEGGYVDLGKSGYSASVTGAAVQSDVKASGLAIAALGILPINESFSLFGKLGLINAAVEIEATASAGGSSASSSISATKIKGNWGLGAAYNVNKQLALRVEYERFMKLGDANSTGEVDVNLLSAGIAFKF